VTTERGDRDESAVADRRSAAAAASDAKASAEPGPPAITPAAALKRHVEWLEYALGAARAEEAARVGRLDTATKKNREKRTVRLAEVRDEVSELTALLQGIRDLQSGARARSGARGTTRAKAPSKAARTTSPRPRPTASPGA